ncbi:hypothetical protein B7G54_36535 [Burkholderia puraquae]|uniref:Uncharacterized protein n=1 Tax=Burkholderia puraquae TaxID=1904757 RepID=A0A1X1P5L2_9BURK|nr:hypothetical protein [Burkholderia puraquae]ORT79689.1 hypothetical protein B7G54_36535 [Burkholderia puraquae]CAB3756658.1 hypothetical protein LMG29660_02934 [Burkholderia puraquae]
MSTHAVETKLAIGLQQAAAVAYRLARDARDADPAHARTPSVAGLQQAAADAHAEAVRARVAATGI